MLDIGKILLEEVFFLYLSDICPLSESFSHNPVLNMRGVAEAVALALGKESSDVTWELGVTREEPFAHHYIPFIVTVGMARENQACSP